MPSKTSTTKIPLTGRTKTLLTKKNSSIMEMRDIFVAHPQSEEEISTLKTIMSDLKIKFEITKKSPYCPNFVAKILESRQQVREGKTVQIELSDIWEE